MDLDVLLPFHRGDKFLISAIKSLNASESVSFRLIAIDDRPSPKTDLSELFSEVKNLEMVSTEGGEGYGAALRAGTSYLNAEVCALMNSDDLVHPERFRLQLEVLNKAEVCSTRIQRISENGRKIPSISGQLTSKDYHAIYLLFGSYGADATWCMRSSWWRNNVFFDNFDCLDWRIGMKVLPNSSVGRIDTPLYFYRKHPNQITSTFNISEPDMSVIFEAWVELSERYGLAKNTRTVFSILATPWCVNAGTSYGEVREWLEIFKKQSMFLNDGTKIVLQFLINRRLILASRSPEISLAERWNFLRLGRSEAAHITKDLFSRFAAQSFHR